MARPRDNPHNEDTTINKSIFTNYLFRGFPAVRTGHRNMKSTVTFLRRAISYFRILMGIQLYENPDSYGFRFDIKIKEKLPKHPNSISIVIKTDIFKILFSRNALHVNLQIADKKRYYCLD